MHLDLHLHPYRVQFTQKLKPADHTQRRRYVKWVLEQQAMDSKFSNKIFFSDEAHFTLGGYLNKQNCRLWGSENSHPEKATVWCALWSEDVIEFYFFCHRQFVALWSYDNQLFLPAIEEYDLENTWWFQQGSATSHTTRANMALLQKTFPGCVISHRGAINWPPRLYYLTLLDSFVGLRERPCVCR